MGQPSDTGIELLEHASGWLIDLTRLFDAWPTTLLVAALLILISVGGVTGRCAAMAPAIRQIILIIVTGLLATTAIAVCWVIYTRIAPTGMLARTLELLHMLAPAGIATPTM